MNTDLFERKNYLSTGIKIEPKDWFSIAHKKNLGYAIVKINTARATLNEARDFKLFLTKEILNKKNKIIIDFGNCEFIDSTFIGTIVKFYNRFNALEKNLILVVPNKRQASILTINKLDRIFSIYNNLDVALRNIKIN